MLGNVYRFISIYIYIIYIYIYIHNIYIYIIYIYIIYIFYIYIYIHSKIHDIRISQSGLSLPAGIPSEITRSPGDSWHHWTRRPNEANAQLLPCIGKKSNWLQHPESLGSIYLSICLSVYLSTLQYITVHYSTLHYIALHYITYKYIYIYIYYVYTCIYNYMFIIVYLSLDIVFFGNILPIPCWRDVFSLVLWFWLYLLYVADMQIVLGLSPVLLLTFLIWLTLCCPFGHG